MPELPEVETVRRTLRPQLLGRTIVSVVVRELRLRFPLEPGALETALVGQRIEDVRRRGKYLLIDLHEGSVLMAHLGMSGRLWVTATDTPMAKHDHVTLSLDGNLQVRFNDARRFGWLEVYRREEEETQPRLEHLGDEPLGEGLDVERHYQKARRFSRTVKSYIMDAQVLVGVGNIYACEALFRAGIHPRAPVRRLSRRRWERLFWAVRETLQEAIDAGGTTLRDYRDGRGAAGRFGGQLRVYGKEGARCSRRGCSGVIRRKVQAGRSTYYCPSCQRF